MLWPEAMAGVVRPSRVPTTRRLAYASAAPPYLSLISGGEFLAHTYDATYSRHKTPSDYPEFPTKFLHAALKSCSEAINEVASSVQSLPSRLGIFSLDHA